jgi:trehalose 6-phosphate phosphatase
MKHILSKGNRELLAQVAWSNVLMAFDFDGTLAPIVADRDDAGMRLRTKKLFAQVCATYPCAVISGRSQNDVSTRVAGMGVKFIVGNHGLEPGNDMGKFAAVVVSSRPKLANALLGLDGIDIEDKGYSLAVHYQRSRRKREARAAIHAAAAKLPVRMRVVPGKLVVNLVPWAAPNKGDALLQLRALAGADTALYVGDDVTDEDVFALDEPGRLLSIRVGASKSSAAPFFVKGQREMDALLQTLVTCARERANHGA